MKEDAAYQRYLESLDRSVERRSERVAAAWRRILPFLDPLDLRFAELERREQQAEIDEELRRLRQRSDRES